jgi:membrane protein DedA with SNARE-associated domain
VEHLQNSLVTLVQQYGYVGLFIGLVLGNVGFPAGAEMLVPIAAALLARGRPQYLAAVFAVALAGELVGGTVGYAVGRFGGRAAAERYGRYVGFHHQRLEAVHRFFERWGSFAVFLCRFIPVVRGLSPFVAGVAAMNLTAFYLWTLLGSALFCGALALVGNAVGVHVHLILPAVHRYGYFMLCAAAVVVVAIVIVSRVRREPS